MIYAPIFCKMKGLIEIHKPGKFHQYSICHCEVMAALAASGWFFKDYPYNIPIFTEI